MIKKPRVLIFSLAQDAAWIGGAEVAVKEITDRLTGQFEFTVISAHVTSFWSKYFFPFSGCRRAAKLHQQNKFDLVWAIMANQAGMAASLFKKKFPAVPFLLTLQEGDDFESLAYRLRLLGPKLFKVFQHADHIQAISHYLADWAKQMGATCPITVIPNGVDLDKFPTRSFVGGKTVITTSRLVSKNGVDTLIKSLTFLPPEVNLQILGSGPDEVALKTLTKNLGLTARVQFMGQLPPAELGKYLSQASVFARPSRSEGLGISFLESMAIGLPTVATPVGGIPDFLKNDETGWLVPVDNPKSLAEKIKFILDPTNQDQVSRVAQAGQKLIREHYNWPTVAQKLATVFNQLI